MKRLHILFFLISFLALTATSGPGSEVSFKKIGTAEGLPHATVNNIAIDGRGFVWIASPEGISRYDSYGFKNYPIGDIRSVAEINGDLWAAGGTTAYRYDRVADSFVAYPMPDSENNMLRTLVAGNTGSTFMAGTSKGLTELNAENGEFRRVFPEIGGVVNAIAVVGDDIYIGMGQKGLVRSDGTQVADFPDMTDVNTLLVNGSTLLIGTEGKGVFSYDTVHDRLTRLSVAGKNDPLADAHVRSLAVDVQGRIWIGTFNGLYILGPDGKQLTEIPTGENGISHSSVRALCRDEQGGMWLGTFFGGLNYYNPINRQFRTMKKTSAKPASLNDNVVSVIEEDRNGKIWMGTNSGGVNVYDPETDRYVYYTSEDGLGSDDVKAIYFDYDNGKAFIGTHIGGLSVLDLKSGRITSAGIPSRNVFAIIPSLDGNLWLDAYNRLFLYDPKKAEILKETEISSGSRQLTRSTGLFRDNSGRLWIYGEDGLMVMKEVDGHLASVDFLPKEFTESATGIRYIMQDTRGRYHVGTGDGLVTFDSDGREISRLGERDGLPSHTVNAMAEDPAGNLWVSTNRGLVRIDADSCRIVDYSQYNNNQYTAKSVLVTSTGEMMFGGVNGVNMFNPSVMERNPYSPRVLITGLRLFDKTVVAGDATGLLEKNIEMTEKLTFSSSQTSFTLEFTVCNYPSDGKNTFYYMLDGLDKGWIPVTDGSRSVTYSNLPAGSYRFRLKAANNDGKLSEEETSIDIRIMPVWYRSWWAMTLWILILAGGIYGIWRVMWHRKMLSERLRLQRIDYERQQRTEEMKVKFFVNMSHELRTPLTLMLLPIDELLSSNPDPITTGKLTAVRNNTMRILHIVNQLLDYRRAEAGMLKLKVRNVNINQKVNDIFSAYRSIARHKDIRYALNSTIDDKLLLPVDSDYLELILNNLLTNAFKYTPSGKSVTVNLSKDDNNLEISVTDTGTGIAKDKLDKIFTRFYQVDDSTMGNGIGLSLVKCLVELHHGDVSVVSSEGTGTTFTVRLPISESAYTEAELRDEDKCEPDSSIDGIAKEDFPIMTETDYEESRGDETEDSDKTLPTILAVDDNREILNYIAEALGGGFRVLKAADGAKALEVLAEEEKVDLILTDVMMPEVDGVKLCHAVKRNLRTSHIPVIMLSAKSELSDQMGGMNVGADDYIAKPFSMDLLKAKIKNQLRTRARLISLYSSSTEIEPEKVAVNPLDEEFLKKAIGVMNAHLDDTEFSTDAFAAEMCMSRSNLHLKMKALTGESTNEFIRRVRLNKAMELLKSGRYNVAEVSAMVGYGSPSYFATSFKKFFGHSPSDLVRRE
ncbi:MAG: response regulator [Muribaculaceae bacterium]|nr:response regulator [Muribaculaceae bacterium]